MIESISPFVRIALRIFGGFMIGRGYAYESDMWIFTDPEIIGVFSLAISECWYALAKWRGWSK